MTFYLQKRRHQAAAFSLVENIFSTLQLRCSLRICPVFDLAKLKERLRASGVLCLVVIVPGVSAPAGIFCSIVDGTDLFNLRKPLPFSSQSSHKMATQVPSDMQPPILTRTSSPDMALCKRETVSYRVEFLNVADLGGQIGYSVQTNGTRVVHQSQPKSFIKLDSDIEVIQLIRNTFQRLIR